MTTRDKEKELQKAFAKFVGNENEKDWFVGTNLDDQIHTGSLQQIKDKLSNQTKAEAKKIGAKK